MVEGRSGDLMLYEPGEIVYHGPLGDADEGFRNDWIYLGGEDISALIEKYPIPLNRPFRIDSTSILRTAISSIYTECSFKEKGYEDKCNLIMSGAIIDIFREYESSLGKAQSNRLDAIRGEIMHDYRRSWTLEEMSRLAGYSKSRFSALYKEKYGTSAIDDLINRRIEEAKLLALYGNMSLSEICEATGFSDIYYFSKCFKKRTGVSPSKYKNNGGN